MADILHRITINAAPTAIYRLLMTQDGLASWWTADVKAEPRVASVARFGFRGGTVVFRMRVDELNSPRRVKWTCLGDFEEWTGTTLEWRIEPQTGRSDASVLSFAHRGWETIEGNYPQCNTDWGRLMYYIKDAAEGRGSGPMM